MYKTPYFNLTVSDEITTMLTKIFDKSNDGLFVCDKNGYTLLYNEALLQISGLPKEIVDTSSTINLYKMNIIPESCAGTSITTKQPYSTIFDYYNGKKAVLSATPFFDQNDEISFVVSYIRDITEINRLREELEETREINKHFQMTLKEIQNDWDENQKFIYRSKSMQQVISIASRLATNDSPILLLGESGVGKDVLANLIHEQSHRMGRFIKINCGAIPDQLLESELFGYEKGAFTGATGRKDGLFELANSGTIFLDEIGDLPYPLQVKLLNVLQDAKIRRVGGTETLDVNVRVIAATNCDLEALVEQKRFRLDLYYRLNVLSITIPPLRERRDDISAIILFYLKQLGKKYKTTKKISNEALEKCVEYNWPGNIRELKNIIERMYHMSDSSTIVPSDLPSIIQNAGRGQLNKSEFEFLHFQPDQPVSLKQAVAEFEEHYISQALMRTLTLQECANTLGVNISTLVRKKRTLGIKYKTF